MARQAVAAIGGALLWLALLSACAARPAGTTISARSPQPGARQVSGLATIRVQFARAMDITVVPELRLTPGVTGTVRWEDERTLALRPSAALLPDTTYAVQLEGEVQGASGAGSGASGAGQIRDTWQFSTRSLRVLYLGWDAGDRVQLFVADAEGRRTSPLTDAPMGVQDYALAPDGQMVAYSASGEGGASDLWLAPVVERDGSDEARRLVDCGGDACRGPSWRPDGQRLVYERRTIARAGEEPGPPRLWWLDRRSGDSRPLFRDETLLGHSARFSDDGRWLSYVVPLQRAMQVYDFEGGGALRLNHETGEPAAWHPWLPELAFNDIAYQGESFSVHLFRLTLPQGETTHLTGDVVTNDAAPGWSPDGAWLAFGRKIPRTPVGRQLWVMRADGSEVRAVTDDPDRNFGPPSWSPDGRQLLAQRFDIQQPQSDPGIWLVDVDDGALHQVAEAGFAPAWLP